MSINFVENIKNVFTLINKLVNNISENIEKWIKPIVNITFFLILYSLTVYGLLHITDNENVKKIIPFAAFVLDLYMLFILSKAKFLWKNLSGILLFKKFKKIDINKLKALGYFFVYTVYTVIYVFLVAVGFYLSEFNAVEEKLKIQKQINTITINQITINQSKSKALIEGLELEVKSKYGDKSKKLDLNISNLSTEDKQLKDELIKSSNNTNKISKSFILSLSEQFGWNIKGLKAIFFGAFVLLMQFCLISSSFDIKINGSSKVKNLDDNKKELLSWLDAAFEGRSGNALNGISAIAEKTGMSSEKCLQYRKYLSESELKVNGGMAITVEPGGTRTNYTKEFIRNYILNH